MLRDGASSQYGSDAIAGVINIQLKKARRGGRAAAATANITRTLPDTLDLDSLQVNGAGQPHARPRRQSLFPRQFRWRAESPRRRAQRPSRTNIGLPVGAGYANLTAEYRDRNATNRAGPDLRPNYVPANGVPAFDRAS